MVCPLLRWNRHSCDTYRPEFFLLIMDGRKTPVFNTAVPKNVLPEWLWRFARSARDRSFLWHSPHSVTRFSCRLSPPSLTGIIWWTSSSVRRKFPLAFLAGEIIPVKDLLADRLPRAGRPSPFCLPLRRIHSFPVHIAALGAAEPELCGVDDLRPAVFTEPEPEIPGCRSIPREELVRDADVPKKSGCHVPLLLLMFPHGRV